MSLPSAASSAQKDSQALTLATVVAARRVWDQMDPLGNWSQQFAGRIGRRLTALVAAAQIAATRNADRYMANVLNELDLADAQPGLANPRAFAGRTGDGRTVEGLLAQSVVRSGKTFSEAKATMPAAKFDPATEAAKALERGRALMDLQLATILADTAREAESAALTAHPGVGGYVRMLNPPSCSRCTILAGRFYRWNEGFLRHPRCDCRHIPANEATAGDLTVNPRAYFDSLSEQDQDRLFTKAGADAIRDGADISQVVNARRNMTTAQRVAQNEAWAQAFADAVKGGASRDEARQIADAAATKVNLPGPQRLRRDANGLYTTDEGASMRGRYGKSQAGRLGQIRLMPESIYALAAGDRQKAIQMLYDHGYILRKP